MQLEWLIFCEDMMEFMGDNWDCFGKNPLESWIYGLMDIFRSNHSVGWLG